MMVRNTTRHSPKRPKVNSLSSTFSIISPRKSSCREDRGQAFCIPYFRGRWVVSRYRQSGGRGPSGGYRNVWNGSIHGETGPGSWRMIVYEWIRAERKFVINRPTNTGAEIVNADGSNFPEINFFVKLCRLWDHRFCCKSRLWQRRVYPLEAPKPSALNIISCR